MFDDIIKDVDEVKKLNLNKDDIIIFKFKNKLHPREKSRIATGLHNILKGREFILLDDGADIEVLKK